MERQKSNKLSEYDVKGALSYVAIMVDHAKGLNYANIMVDHGYVVNPNCILSFNKM